ncbi:adh short, KR, NAD binding 10, and/or Epimerase domain containing protein, partial [Asbolus verrucosus]
MVLSMDPWRGKVAVVTGAGGGIGTAVAKKLVEEGLEVAGLDERSELVEELSKKLSGKKGKLHALKTDVTEDEAVQAAFKWVVDNLGPVHVLVNCAGLMQATSLTDGDTEKWKKTFDVNVLGLSIATREAVKVMRANNINGHIIHINSMAGHAVQSPILNVYPASKFAVTALTETLRQELNHVGSQIKITSISPGAVNTDFLKNNEIKVIDVNKIPTLDTEDVADAVSYVLSTPLHVQVVMVLSMDRWKGKVAVVTGASSGIGAAVAEKLVEEGLQVVGLARRSERVEELSKKLKGKKGKLFAVKTDITNEEDVIEAFRWASDNLGPVHILVNNAGILQQTNLIDGDTEKWKKTLDTNVLGLCIATREAIKIMRTNNIDGHIVHLNSIAGHGTTNFPFANIYPATKHAVTALTETLRQELNQLALKIKITSVSPGVVSSEILHTNNFAIDPKFEVEHAGMPVLKPEDVADSILFVLSTPQHVQVAGIARRSERVEELAKKLQGKKGTLHAIKADMSKEEDILNAFKQVSEKLGPVHILINNAGILQQTNLVEGDTEKWKKIFDTNVLGLCIATREAVKIMRANNIDGHI